MFDVQLILKYCGCAGPGQALLSQLQMPRSLSSGQQAQRGASQPLPDEWGLPQSFSNMPFFDPAVLSATSSSYVKQGELQHSLHMCRPICKGGRHILLLAFQQVLGLNYSSLFACFRFVFVYMQSVLRTNKYLFRCINKDRMQC